MPGPIIVSAGEAGLRLDQLVARRLENVSVRTAARMAGDGCVRVNGRREAKGRRVVEGDRVEIDQDAIRAHAGDFAPRPDGDVEVRILHRDERTLVVDKPSGIHSAPVRGSEEGTLVGGVLARFPDAARVRGHHLREAGLVHRLDRSTSGACLFALDQDAFDRLRTASESDLVVKDYLALVEGPAIDGPPILEAAIEVRRSRGARVHVESVVRKRGKSLAPRQAPPGYRLARMRVDVLGATGSHSLVRVKLTRGFRHQVRSVLAAVGNPVVGDRRYGARESAAPLMLHASRIVYPHPTDGRLVKVDCPCGRIEERWSALRGSSGGRPR
jgi:RluA family pseudouridine synthase